MDTEITVQGVQDVLQDITPPLELSWGLLKDIIEIGSGLPRNTQKTLHFISRVTEILKALRKPFSEPPLNLDDIMKAMESLRTLERTLIKAKPLIKKEAELPTTFSKESISTWEKHRKELYDLVKAVHASEFDPPDGWQDDLKEIARVDDSLWVGLMAHDMWSKSDLEDAEEAERVAAKLLEEPQNEEDAETSPKEDIKKVMEAWERSQEEPPRPLFDFSVTGFGLLRSGTGSRTPPRKGSTGRTPPRQGSTSGAPPRQGSPTSRGFFSKTLQRVTSSRRGSSGFTEIPPGEIPTDGKSSPKPQSSVPGKGGSTKPAPNQTNVTPKPSNAQQSQPATDPVSSTVNPTMTVSLSSDLDYHRPTGQDIDYRATGQEIDYRATGQDIGYHRPTGQRSDAREPQDASGDECADDCAQE